MNETMQLKTKVNVYSVQLLDFATKDGQSISGIKVFFTEKATGEFKDNFLGGQASSIFLSGKDFVNLFNTGLKTIKFPCQAEILSEFVAMNKAPRPVGINFIK